MMLPSYIHQVKPIADRTLALIALLLLTPLLGAIAIAIAIDSPGPVLFQQTRRGFESKSFTIFKFRTMVWQPSQLGGHQTKRNDDRLTYLGKYLRRTSLDELPQLLNVLLGEMSLVGPRPLAEELHCQDTPQAMATPAYERRYSVKPGITGWAQIHGLRGAIRNEYELHQRIIFDNHYVSNISCSIDLLILLRTASAIVKAENAF